VLADLGGWRSVFLVVGVCVAVATIAAAIGLRGLAARPQGVSPAVVIAAYREVLDNPRTKICYGAVFLEGVALFGLFPFIAVFLLAAGEPRASIAGLVISAFAIGGILYTLAVRPLVSRFRRGALMAGGGLVVALGLLLEAGLPPWPVQALALAAMGFGFYLMHGCLMVEMSELAPGARGTAVAGHAFSFYLGQALGPAVFGLGVAVIGSSLTMLFAGVVMALIGYVAARLLRTTAAD